MYRRRLREARRHHHGVLVAQHRMRRAFRGLVDARFEGRLVLLAGFMTVAVALGAFAIAVTVAAAATTAATAATAAILTNSVIGHRAFTRLAFPGRIFFRRAGVVILVRNLVLGVDTAHAAHGGDGAFYVRLRRG